MRKTQVSFAKLGPPGFLMNCLRRLSGGHFKRAGAALLAAILTPAGLTAQAITPTAPPVTQTSGSASSAAAKSSAGRQPTERQRAKAEAFYLKGLQAIHKGDIPAAGKAFARAAQEDPTNRTYSLDRDLAHEGGVTELVRSADEARIEGHPGVARAKLAQAMALDPKNAEVSQHLYDLADESQESSPDDLTATLAPPVKLAAKPGKLNFHLKGSEQEIAKQVLDAYGLSPTFDSSVGTKPIRFDADGVNFAQASNLLGLATGTFIVPLDPRSVLVAKDTKENHTRYDRLAVETLHLRGLNDAEMNEVGNVIRNVMEIQKVSMQTQSATVTVRAPMPVITALNRTLGDLLDGQSEVLLDVRLFSIDRTKTLNIGLQPPQTFTAFNVASQADSLISQNESLVQQIISSGLANAGDTVAIAALLIASGQVSGSALSQPFALFGGGLTESGVSFSGVQANLELNSTDTRALDDVQLRLKDKEEGTIRSGVKYPIETSSYSSISPTTTSIPGLNSSGLSSSLAALGVNLNSLASAQPIPQVQYQDIGLTLTLTPTVQQSDEVALNVNLKLTALLGTSLNGLPLLTNTSFSSDVVVARGSSALLMSDMSRSESKAVSGVPGLSELPGFQTLSANNQTDLDVSDLVVVITPHLIRRRHNERSGPYIPLPRI